MATKRVMKHVAPADHPINQPAKATGVTKKAVPKTVVTEYDPEDYDGGSPVSVSAGNGDVAIRGGWGAAQETIDSTSNYAQTFRPDTKTQVIRFLDAKPYAAFRRHWIDRVGIGKRPYVCLVTVGQDCPLCAIGDKPGAVTAFNIALLSDDGIAALKSWECGVKISKQLETFHKDVKIGPLDRPGLYFLVSKSEATQRQQVTTMVTPVRGRDLLEDYGTPPLDEVQEEKLRSIMYPADIVTVNPAFELAEIAAEMTGDAPPGDRPWGS